MLSETQIQLKAQEYLQRFEQTHIKKQNLLKELEAKVNNAAIKIQRVWRSYAIKKRNYYALKIQKAWKRYGLKLKCQRAKVKRFREVFFKGKIAWFVFRMYFKQKHKHIISCVQTSNIPTRTYQISSVMVKNFGPYINLSQAYVSQSSYIQKLRAYEKDKFSQSWQLYEQRLISQLQKQATRKWVKKNQSIWITQQGKEINLAEYIEKNVSKIFQREYNKYREVDNKLQNTSAVLKQKIHQFTVHYYRAILQGNHNAK